MICAARWPCVLGLLIAFATSGATGAATGTAPAVSKADERIDLAAASFSRNGLPSEAPTGGAPGTAEAGSVSLPFSERGVRWAMQWSTSDAFTARLALEWIPGPDGALFEIVLDGQRLSPARDGWRPSAREVTSDLGSVWLGAGGHLLEFVAREQSPSAALHLRALVLERL